MVGNAFSRERGLRLVIAPNADIPRAPVGGAEEMGGVWAQKGAMPKAAWGSKLPEYEQRDLMHFTMQYCTSCMHNTVSVISHAVNSNACALAYMWLHDEAVNIDCANFIVYSVVNIL